MVALGNKKCKAMYAKKRTGEDYFQDFCESVRLCAMKFWYWTSGLNIILQSSLWSVLFLQSSVLVYVALLPRNAVKQTYWITDWENWWPQKAYRIMNAIEHKQH